MAPRIVIVAGEASGDQLGRGLIEALRQKFPDATFEGVTGPQMEAAGCHSWSNYEPLAVMGIAEVLRHLPRLRRFKKTLETRLRADPPDLLIGIDAPDFNLRLEKFARGLGIATVHYVCPSVWAWRSGRVKAIRAAADLVLCLLPFEPDFVGKHGIRAVFVGHPMADEIVPDDNVAAARESLGLNSETVVALLPGSRAGEIDRLGTVFLQAASTLRDQHPEIRFISAAASEARRAQFVEQCATAGMQESVQVTTGNVRQVMAAADAVLVASGTATLETMLMLKPMVVAYRIAPLTAWLLRITRMMKIRYFSLPNLLAGYELVPEYIQEQVTPEALSDAIAGFLSPGAQRDELIDKFRVLSAELRQSASDRAADAVAELIRERGIAGGD